MKKLNALTAVLAAGAMLIGSLMFVSCQGETEPEAEATLTKITVNTSNATTEFLAGDEFSSDGIVVKAVYSDNTKKTVSAKNYTVAIASANLDENLKLKFSGADVTDHKETVKVTVTYQGKTATYDITIAEVPTKIEITADDTVKKEYSVGDDIDYTGVTVNAYYGDDDNEGTDVTSAVTLSATYKVEGASGDEVTFTTETEGTYHVRFIATYGALSATTTDFVDITVSVAAREFKNGAESDAKSSLGSVIYWNDQNWCGSTVTVNSTSNTNSVYTLNYSATGSCTFGIQYFMAETLTSGKKYLISAKLKSSIAKTVTFNGTAYELTVDTEKEVCSLVSGDGATTVISIQTPITGSETNATFSLSDIELIDVSDVTTTLSSITATLDKASINVGEIANVSVTGNYTLSVNNKEYTIPQAITEGITCSVTGENVTIDGTAITGKTAANIVSITVKANDKETTVTCSVIDYQYENVVLYSSTNSANNLKKSGNTLFNVWNGGISQEVSNDTTKTGLKISFTSLNGGNSCGGYELDGVKYNKGAKLTMDVYASHGFSVKPVKPDVEYAQTVSTDGTEEKVSVSIDLGDANEMTQLGFISTVVQDIYVDNIKIEMATSE